MTLYKGKYRVESNRLKGYDYSLSGGYFITICTVDMKKILGNIKNGEFIGNSFADIVYEKWFDLPNHYINCILDQFVIMPNHIHGIIYLRNELNQKNYPVSEIIRAFKTFSTKTINQLSNSKGESFWQKNYYDRVIRNEKEFDRIREYIYYNPLRWQWDKEYFEKTVITKDKLEL